MSEERCNSSSLYARIQDGKHSQEIAEFQAELAEARTQLQLLQKQLDEQLSKQPVENQEVTVGAALHPSRQGLQSWPHWLPCRPFMPGLLGRVTDFF